MQETATSHGPTTGPLTYDELGLAVRNHSLPLEALRWDTTPIGLHYLLIHFDIPAVDPDTWRLRIGGRVRRPMELDLDDIKARPTQTVPVTMECAGNGRALLDPRPLSQPWLGQGVGTAEWTGTPLAPILADAGIEADAVDLVFGGADHGIQGDVEHDYERGLSISQATRPEVMLVHAMNGGPLPPQHGFPLRLLVPGWYGMTSVKWLTSITAITAPFAGYQQITSYRYKVDADDPGQPVERMRVRALMIPPGMPDYFTRRRFVDAGPVRIRGRAWSGAGPITKVEVGAGGTWAEAELDAPLGDHAWRGWSFDWDAVPGEGELLCRATDASGAVQPDDPPWNYQGMGNNAVQRVRVTVR
jgi:DMSO/TMAO reductase YedYZ molybdopterin-dependent catalytic subunit